MRVITKFASWISNFFYFVTATPLILVVLYFQLKSVHYTLQFMSWYLFNPTFEQSNLISSARVLDANIFGGLRWAAGNNIYDYTYDPLVNNPYIYPPFFAFLGYQLSKLPYSISHLGWLAVVAASFYIFLLLAGLYIYTRSKKIWLSLSFIGIGVLSQLILGQINYGHYFLMLLPLIFGIYLTKNKILAVLLWGISIGISLYAALLLSFVWIKFGFKTVVSALVIALLFQFPLIFNWPSAASYPGFLLNLNKYFFEQPNLSFNLRETLYHLSPFLDLILVLILLSLLVIVSLNFAKANIKKYDLYLSFLIASSMMIDPLISDHHLPLIYIIYALNFHRSSFFLLFPFLFIVNDFHLGLYNQDPQVYGYLLNHSLRHLGMIVTFGYCFYQVRDYYDLEKAAKLIKVQLRRAVKLIKLRNNG